MDKAEGRDEFHDSESEDIFDLYNACNGVMNKGLLDKAKLDEFSPEEAKRRLAKGREVKYFHELEAVIDRALERIQFHSEMWGVYPGARKPGPSRDPIAEVVWP